MVSNYNLPDLHLPNNWNYMCEQWHPPKSTVIYKTHCWSSKNMSLGQDCDVLFQVENTSVGDW
jgi:hypothetical protein